MIALCRPEPHSFRGVDDANVHRLRKRTRREREEETTQASGTLPWGHCARAQEGVIASADDLPRLEHPHRARRTSSDLSGSLAE